LGEQEYNKLLLEVEAYKSELKAEKLNALKSELEILRKAAEAIKPSQPQNTIEDEAIQKAIIKQVEDVFNNYVPEPVTVNVEGFVPVDVKSDTFLQKLDAEILKLSQAGQIAYVSDSNGIMHPDIKSIKDRLYLQETIKSLQAQLPTLKKEVANQVIADVSKIAQPPSASAAPEPGGNSNSLVEFMANKAMLYANR
jgi:hypothetical protein